MSLPFSSVQVYELFLHDLHRATTVSQYNLWDQADSYILSLDQTGPGIVTTGLLDTILYDTLPIGPGGAWDEVAVNATQANVTCAYIPNATATQVADQVNVEAKYDTYHFAFSTSLPMSNATVGGNISPANETAPVGGMGPCACLILCTQLVLASSHSNIPATILYVNTWHFDGGGQQNSSMSIPKVTCEKFLDAGRLTYGASSGTQFAIFDNNGPSR